MHQKKAASESVGINCLEIIERYCAGLLGFVNYL